MLPEEQIQQIEAWLDGTMHSEERQAFEARMRTDPGLVAAVALHEKLRQAVREKDIGAFRQTIDGLLGELRADSSSPPTAKNFQRSRYVWVFAAALLLALAAIWFFLLCGASPEQLYADAFQPPKQFNEYSLRRKPGFRDTDSASNLLNSWAALNTAWVAGDKEQSLSLALEIARTDTVQENRLAAFYAAGLISLAQDNPDAALEYLQNAEDLPVYQEEIVWYSALLAQVKRALRDPAYMAQAIQSLEKVEQSSQPAGRHQWAKKLLEGLADQPKN